MNIRNKTISRKAMERAAGLLEQLSLEEKLRQLGCTMLSGTEEPLEEKDLAGGIGVEYSAWPVSGSMPSFSI